MLVGWPFNKDFLRLKNTNLIVWVKKPGLKRTRFYLIGEDDDSLRKYKVEEDVEFLGSYLKPFFQVARYSSATDFLYFDACLEEVIDVLPYKYSKHFIFNLDLF